MCSLAWLMLAGAVAQTTPTETNPSEAQLNEARRLYQVGSQWYEEGQYARSIDAFQEAYRLTGSPAVLFNIANAQERGGWLVEAIDTLERYRLVAPEDELPVIRRRILAIQERVLAARERPPETSGSAASVSGPSAVPVDPVPAVVPVARQPRWRLVGVGTATAVVLGGVAAGTYAASRQAVQRGDESTYDATRVVNNGSLAVASGGAVLAVVGLVWQRPKEAAVSVSMAPTGASLQVRF